jgi:hypothetical protein
LNLQKQSCKELSFSKCYHSKFVAVARLANEKKILNNFA